MADEQKQKQEEIEEAAEEEEPRVVINVALDKVSLSMSKEAFIVNGELTSGLWFRGEVAASISANPDLTTGEFFRGMYEELSAGINEAIEQEKAAYEGQPEYEDMTDEEEYEEYREIQDDLFSQNVEEW